MKYLMKTKVIEIQPYEIRYLLGTEKGNDFTSPQLPTKALFCSTKQLGVLLLPPGCDASPSQGTQHQATRSITTLPGCDV